MSGTLGLPMVCTSALDGRGPLRGLSAHQGLECGDPLVEGDRGFHFPSQALDLGGELTADEIDLLVEPTEALAEAFFKGSEAGVDGLELLVQGDGRHALLEEPADHSSYRTCHPTPPFSVRGPSSFVNQGFGRTGSLLCGGSSP